MISVPLNIIILVLCLVWLYRSKGSIPSMWKITMSFLGSSVIAFILAFTLEHAYLEGIVHLVFFGVSSILFWIGSLIIIWKGKKKFGVHHCVSRSAVVSIVIVFPVLLLLFILNTNFKIGG